jgi:nickel-dependent lactate racemase
MTKTQIPYGSRLIDMDIDGKQLDLDSGRSNAKYNDPDVIKHAIEKPVGTKRLREIVDAKKNANITIVVDDHTRNAPTAKMLDALTEEVGEAHKISLLVACGTHAPPTEEELRRMLGPHFHQFEIVIHNCDAKDLVHFGTTSRGTPVTLNRHYVDADVRVLTGDITVHYYAGFGGGRKSIVPGISSRETIRRNHALLVDDRARTANIANNPVHLDMAEAASFAPPDFVLNTVANGNENMVDAYAGEMNTVFLMGAEVAKSVFCLETHELFDLLVVSAGGFPKDRNLYQATKAVENCYRAVVPGGTLILVAECCEGIGDAYFEDWMNEYTSYEAVEDAIKANFVLGGHKAFYMRKAMERVRLSIVSELDTHILRRWGIKVYKSVRNAVEEERNINDKIKVGTVKNGMDTLLVPVTKEQIKGEG